MSKIKNKLNWKQIICAVLVVASSIAAIGGIASFTGSKTKTISSLAFKVGALDDNGKYVEDNQSIYTKDAFECIGLRVEPDFDADLTYDVYYYNEKGEVINTKLDHEGVYDEDFPLAYKARVVIHPEIPEDADDDWKISFLEVSNYASKVKISVDRKQKYLYEGLLNLYDSEKVTANKSYLDGNVKPSEYDSDTLYDREYGVVTDKISLVGYEKIDIFVKSNNIKGGRAYETFVSCFFAKEDGSIAATDGSCHFAKQYSAQYCEEWVKISLDIPEDIGVDHMLLYIGTNGPDVQIYGLK